MSRWAGPLAIGVGIAALIWLERKHPLRPCVEPGPKRLARNLAIGAVTAAAVNAIERPIVERCARLVEERGWGLTPHLPPALRTVAAVVLMDYTLYWWHVLLHRVPALWKLHEPHHADPDLDVTTGVRFHFTEFLASIPWRVAQVLAIGVTPRSLRLWQQLTLAEVLFHHSNLRLPRDLERTLADVIVTPRLHGVHHSVVREERDSNFSSGLTMWDRLHGTGQRTDRDDVTIGLPGHDRTETLAGTLALPFRQFVGCVKRGVTHRR